jgi:hypothetical protein
MKYIKHPYIITNIRKLDWHSVAGTWLYDHHVAGVVTLLSSARMYYISRLLKSIRFKFRIRLVLDILCEGKTYRIVVATLIQSHNECLSLHTQEYTQDNNEFIRMLLNDIINDEGGHANV